MFWSQFLQNFRVKNSKSKCNRKISKDDTKATESTLSIMEAMVCLHNSAIKSMVDPMISAIPNLRIGLGIMRGILPIRKWKRTVIKSLCPGTVTGTGIREEVRTEIGKGTETRIGSEIVIATTKFVMGNTVKEGETVTGNTVRGETEKTVTVGTMKDGGGIMIEKGRIGIGEDLGHDLVVAQIQIKVTIAISLKEQKG